MNTLTICKKIKTATQQHNAYLKSCFSPEKPILSFLHAKSSFTDKALLCLWQQLINTQQAQNFALIAVGGYGRQEMFPYSDVDLLILSEDSLSQTEQEPLTQLCTALWDTGLKLGLSVRSHSECLQAAKDDQTVMTSLMESRLLAGNKNLLEQLNQHISGHTLWSSEDFFNAKIQEQKQRYKKFHDTAYNLEPNIKESPGGLRDLQIISWVFKYHYQCKFLQDLKHYDLLTQAEYKELFAAREHLWKIRFALHLQTSRCEDRLLFDHQHEIACTFGYSEQKNNQGIEQFMQHYFKQVMQLERLNETLLQLFNEHCIPQNISPQTINTKFSSIAGYITTNNPDIFQTHPRALLEIFILIQKIPSLKGIRATTIRQIRANLALIDDSFRADPLARQLFIDILRQPRAINRVLRSMNRYGVLAAYLPSFNNIVGRMQYDLFHIYTVDAHTLFVLRNLRRFALEKHNKELPFCNGIFLLIPKPHILYIAALFHDIAKGKKGDHSVLGEEIVKQFCLDHKISEHDSKVICWLVKNHLIMSSTAQRKDISDPAVIHTFAEKIRKTEYLNYLYLLTVADIRATNPKLWTSWKDSLLRELYSATLNALRRGLENPILQEDTISETKNEAHQELIKKGLSDTSINRAWQHINDDYFLRYYSDEIIWHTLAIEATPEAELPLVLLRPQNQRGSVEIFIYTHDKKENFVFSRSTAALDSLGLTILDARIITTKNQYTLNSFQVLEQSGNPLGDIFRKLRICSVVKQQLKTNAKSPEQTLARTRQAANFPIKTQAFFHEDKQLGYTRLELITTDQPGLLSKIGRLFREHDFNVINAKVTTIGSRAEDMFYLTNSKQQPIPKDQQESFIGALLTLLA
ncbi:MAG: [protein-PII] uridylyltransferase [Methyloprofundus sp.]|nr:[protein-PII] uridylyltransferase [Methyloprofundus sp.]